MELTVEALEKLSTAELLSYYYKIRRQHAEKKFARDSERGRLTWLSARLFVTSRGGVTEREKAVEASEDLAKKGQHVREMSLDLDLTKIDIDLITLLLRTRGTSETQALPEFADGEQEALRG